MFPKSPIEAKLDEEILTLLGKLAECTDKTSKEYDDYLKRLSELYKLKPESRPKQISPDTVLVVAANIFGIIWLTRYERENVITSKSALSFVKKP